MIKKLMAAVICLGLVTSFVEAATPVGHRVQYKMNTAKWILVERALILLRLRNDDAQRLIRQHEVEKIQAMLDHKQPSSLPDSTPSISGSNIPFMVFQGAFLAAFALYIKKYNNRFSYWLYWSVLAAHYGASVGSAFLKWLVNLEDKFNARQ